MTFRLAEIDVSSWRPQLFGRANVRKVKDPLIEPLWEGERVLIRIGEVGGVGPSVGNEGQPTESDVPFFDVDGEELVGPALDAIAAELRDGIRADGLVLDGYLSRQPNTPPPNAANLGVKMPSAQQMVGQMLFGRRSSTAPRAPLPPGSTPGDPDVPIAFVAVDLLAIDDQALLDIPLLERKRILDTAFDESRLVRRGPYVRPPVDSWLIAWRALGFRELAYKAANGRYTPGVQNETWARVTIPLD